MEDFMTYIYIIIVLVSLVSGFFGKKKESKPLPRRAEGREEAPVLPRTREVMSDRVREERSKELTKEMKKLKQLLRNEKEEEPSRAYEKPVNQEQAYLTEEESSGVEMVDTDQLRQGILWQAILERPRY
jgi:hypothetical protein